MLQDISSWTCELVLLSVIVPTRNRAHRLGDLIDTLARQDPVSFEWEVIVVDNASSDNTSAVVRQKSQAHSIQLSYIVEPRLGLHNSRHRGAQEANGEYLGFLDDDMLLAPTWLQGVQLLSQGLSDAVAGRILPRWEVEPPKWLRALSRDGVFSHLGLLDLGSNAKSIDPFMVFGGNCFLPRSLVFDLRGFHPDSIEPELLHLRGDGETGLMRKFKEAGLEAWYDPAATAFHVISADRISSVYLCQRAYNQGVSDSFTHIRAEFFDKGIVEVKRSPLHYLRRAREMSSAELLRATASRFGQIINRILPRPQDEIRNKMDAAYLAGWRFHQEAVRKDPKLLEYVTRDTYISDDINDRELER